MMPIAPVVVDCAKASALIAAIKSAMKESRINFDMLGNSLRAMRWKVDALIATADRRVEKH
jgi:hypothetical protein